MNGQMTVQGHRKSDFLCSFLSNAFCMHHPDFDKFSGTLKL